MTTSLNNIQRVWYLHVIVVITVALWNTTMLYPMMFFILYFVQNCLKTFKKNSETPISVGNSLEFIFELK